MPVTVTVTRAGPGPGPGRAAGRRRHRRDRHRDRVGRTRRLGAPWFAWFKGVITDSVRKYMRTETDAKNQFFLISGL